MPDDSVATRTTLLERLKDWGDSPSWQEFFDTYWKLIYSFALRSGLTETEAQDVVQETMVSVARHMPGFKYDRTLGSFKHWLLTMARWRVLDQMRKRKNFTFPIHDDNATETKTKLVNKIADPASSNLEAFWETEWEKTILEAAMTRIKRQLDPEKYQIFDFLVNKEWPPQKVADTFRITVNQVYIAKHRVTELIREEVGRINKGSF